MINTTSDVKSDSFGVRSRFQHFNVALYWPDASAAPVFSTRLPKSMNSMAWKGRKAVSGHTSGKDLLLAVATLQHKLNYRLMF